MNCVTSRRSPPTISGCAVIAVYTASPAAPAAPVAIERKRAGQADQRDHVRGRAAAVDTDVAVLLLGEVVDRRGDVLLQRMIGVEVRRRRSASR